MCVKTFTEEECRMAARQLNKTIQEVFHNSNEPYPPGCYMWTPEDDYHGVYFNSALTGNVKCTEKRECLCKKAGNKHIFYSGQK